MDFHSYFVLIENRTLRTLNFAFIWFMQVVYTNNSSIREVVHCEQLYNLFVVAVRKGPVEIFGEKPARHSATGQHGSSIVCR